MFYRKRKHKNKIKVWDGELESYETGSDYQKQYPKKKGKKKKRWAWAYDSQLTASQMDYVVDELLINRPSVVVVMIQ